MKMRDMRVSVAKGTVKHKQFSDALQSERLWVRCQICIEKELVEEQLIKAIEIHKIDQSDEYKELMQKYMTMLKDYVQTKMSVKSENVTCKKLDD